LAKEILLFQYIDDLFQNSVFPNFGKEWPPDLDVFKVEIPATATQQTSWTLTHQDRISYYTPQIISKDDKINSTLQITQSVAKERFRTTGSDAHALALGKVSTTPISLDHTSRVSFPLLHEILLTG